MKRIDEKHSNNRLRACFPEKRWLFRDVRGKSYYAGQDDVWVRIIPPSWGTTKLRQQMLASGEFNDEDRILLDIYLCYGGTNLEIEVPQRDDSGMLVWDDEGIVTEMIAFDETGQLSWEEFVARMDGVPMPVVEHWHQRTLEIATEWKYL